MSPYKAPGVYVNEVSSLPASVSPVPTAVPVFIGYTEKAPASGVNDPVKVTSLAEYQETFGGGPQLASTVVNLDANNAVTSVVLPETWKMYDSLRLFYSNGGGNCFIISIGLYTDAFDKQDFLDGIDKLEYADEPTLICMPDLVLLQDDEASNDDEDFGEVQAAALAHAAEMQDRFCIFDLREKSSETGWSYADYKDQFRTNIGTQNLSYGAAYSPWLKTNITSSNFTFDDIDLYDSGGATDLQTVSSEEVVAPFYGLQSDIDAFFSAHVGTGSAFTYTGWFDDIYNDGGLTDEQKIKSLAGVVKDAAVELAAMSTGSHFGLEKALEAIAGVGSDLEILVSTLNTYDVGYDTPVANITDPNLDLSLASAFPGFTLSGTGDNSIYTPTAGSANDHLESSKPVFEAQLLAIIQYVNDLDEASQEVLEATSAVWAGVAKAVRAEGAVLPPSGAMAGVYASVDRNRGVWKAPANLSLSGVVKPITKYNDSIQGDLNIPDDGSGKAINAIRYFTGKGNMVWGARTLAGNSAEWRFVPVRRLFIFAEESIKKASEFVVFEPNDANTWLRVKGMIENFLTGLWRDGALAGASPKEAFFVNVGLGSSMTQQDILDGNLIIEVGMAAVRPAEFVVLKFSHKLQES